MKKQITRFLMFSILFTTAAFTSFAQDDEAEETSEIQFNHVLKTNVLGYLGGQYQVAYEHPLNSHFSVQLSAGYILGGNNGTLGSSNYETKKTGYIIIPEARYYFANEAPTKFYIGAFLRYRAENNDLQDNSWTTGGTGTDMNLSRERKVSSFGGGAIVGYQFITAGGFTLDVFAGPQYKSRGTKISYDNAALNEPADDPAAFESRGDELFSAKFLNFEIADNANVGLRFGFNLGYAF